MKKKFTIEVEAELDVESSFPDSLGVNAITGIENDAPSRSEAETTLIGATVILGKSFFDNKKEFKEFLAEGVDLFWDIFDDKNAGGPVTAKDLMALFRHNKKPQA